jgi:hypothetical protein
MHKPVKKKRFFHRRKRYSAIKWNDEKKAIKAFRKQLVDWYIRPIQKLVKTPHAEFAVLALTCTLIDCLSQYEAGRVESDNAVFKAWLKSHFKRFARTFPIPIKYLYHGHVRELKNYADAIYTGFRCGILHEAHVALYGAITGQKQAVSYHKKGLTLYDDGSDCPCVVIHPRLFFKRIKTEFEDYFDRLLDPAAHYEPLRVNFKKKFRASYGINIGHEP